MRPFLAVIGALAEFLKKDLICGGLPSVKLWNAAFAVCIEKRRIAQSECDCLWSGLQDLAIRTCEPPMDVLRKMCRGTFGASFAVLPFLPSDFDTGLLQNQMLAVSKDMGFIRKRLQWQR